MDTSAVQKIGEILGKNQAVSIVVGKNARLDEMAAALSLYLSLKTDGKQVSIATPVEPIVELSSLIGINKVKTSLGSDKGDLTVSFPYEEGEIEKVSYTLENGYLNIIVKAGQNGLSFSEKDINYKRTGGQIAVLFVVGTPRLSDLETLFDPEALKNTTVINIDNKSENQGFGDISCVSQSFSSVSEAVASLLATLSLPIDQDIAQNLLSGMSFATDNFTSTKTSPTAFEMVAYMLRKGAVREQKQQRQRPVQDTFSQFGVPTTKPQARGDSPFGQPRDQKGFRPRSPFPFQRPQSQASRPQFQTSTPQYSPMPKNNPTPPPFIEQKDSGKEDDLREEAPADWLTPKVYKGSTLV